MLQRPFLLSLAILCGIGVVAFAGSKLLSDDPSLTDSSQLQAQSPVAELLQHPPGEMSPEQLADVVDSLVQLLDEEIRERRVLEQRLEDLQTEIEALRRVITPRVSTAPEGSQAVTRAQMMAERERTIDDQLTAAGFTQQQLASVERLIAESTMERIELDDRARREGWINTPRYFEALNALGDGAENVRAYLGDDQYDRYLYGTGNSNRVTVQSVIETSPAQRAGLRAGDVILSYGGRNVYATGELVNLRSSGDPGMPVTVEIIRDGQRMQITMPRGPMGINTGGARIDPAE